MINKQFDITHLRDNSTFEEYIMFRASQVGSLTSLLGCLSNLLLNLSLALTLATLIGFFSYGLLALLIRKYKCNKLILSTISIFTIFYLNVLWVLNYRSNGPILHLLVVCYLFVQLFSSNTNMLNVAGIAFFNLLLLFLFDYSFPSLTNQYPNQLAELTDNYIVTFFSIFLLLLTTEIFKKYYTQKLVQSQESEKLKSAFLANLSHEIRTPLNAILGFSMLLNEEYSTETKEKFCQIINEKGSQLCELIDRLIVVSKLESDNLKLVTEECNIKAISEDLYTEYAPRFEQKSIDFDYLLRGQQTVCSDSRMLKLVLSELLSNSLKFSRLGRTRLGVFNCSKGCVFFVKDYGIGIRDQNKKKIFDSFVKITESSSGLVGGTGIGLNIVKKAVQLMGSEIKLKSTYKKGSVFYFILPVVNQSI